MTLAVTSAKSLSGERASTLTADVVAGLVSGELRGAPDTIVDSIAALDRAGPSQLGFFAHLRYTREFASTRAGIVLVTPSLADAPGPTPSRIVVENPHQALLCLLPRLYPALNKRPGIHATARIGRGVKLGEGVSLDEYVVIGEHAVVGDGVWIGAHCVVGDRVMIGTGSRLLPGATLYSGAELGERVVIHSGARIGADGFGYVFADGAHARIPHVGRCVVGNDVEVGANTTIDRGSIDDTVIGDGTKIDNLVQIAHNVRVGRLCLIMAQAGIAGSVRIEDGCVIAGQAGVSGHVTIGKGAQIAAQAGVFGDVPAGEIWSGYPARPHRESLRASGALFRLSGVLKRIERMLEESERE